MKSLRSFWIVALTILSIPCFACPPLPPEAVIDTVATPIYVGQTVYFDGSDSFCPEHGDDSCLTYTWEFPQEAYYIHGNGTPNVKCKFFPVGNDYEVSLTVKCQTTGQEDTDIITIDVLEAGSPWYVSTAGDDEDDGQDWQTAFRTIQMAIDTASNGHTIKVDDGTYYENIDLKGKNLQIISEDYQGSLDGWELTENTIIDGQMRGATVSFRGDEAIPGADQSNLEGFTITGGYPAGNGLALRLELEDGSGSSTATDSSGKGRDGTLNNEPTWSTDRNGGGALLFDGTNYVEINGYKGVVGTGSRTCSAWIRTTSALQGNIVSWGDGQNDQKWMFRIEDGTLGVGVWGGYIKTTQTVNDDQWHHVAAVLENDGSPDVSEILLYIDGILQLDTNVTGSQLIHTAADQNVMIGVYENNSSYSSYFTGLIDDVKIYSRALTGDEIKDLAGVQHPVAYWKMDDDAANTEVMDASENERDGVSQRNTVGMSVTEGDGFIFDGSTDYITVQDDPDLRMGADQNFSISLWFKTSVMSLNQHLINKGVYDGTGNGTGVYQILINGQTNQIIFRMEDTTTCVTILSDEATEVCDGDLHHVVVTCDRLGVATMYIDGVPQDNSNCPADISFLGSIDGTNDDLLIGTAPDFAASKMWNGLIDDVRIYNYVLTQPEITALHTGTGPTLGLLGHWELDDNAANKAVEDSSGNGHSGTSIRNTSIVATTSKVGRAMVFNGVNDKVEISGYNGITGKDSRSMACWIKTTKPNGTIISWGTASSPGQRWILRTQDDSDGNDQAELRLEVNGGRIIGTTNIIDGQWHHIAAVFDNDGSSDLLDATLYIDGQVETLGTVDNWPINTGTSQEVQIGISTEAGEGNYFGGLIDDLRIYNRALSSSEISILADKHPNLIVHYKFDKENNDITSDETTNGYDGLVQGDSELVTGLFGNAYSFDGSGDFIIVDGSGSYTKYSVSLWFNTSQSDSSSETLFSDAHTAGSGSSGRPQIGVRDNRAYITGGDSSGTKLYSALGMADGNWHHLTATTDTITDEIELYVDGRYYGSYDNNGFVFPLDLNNGLDSDNRVEIGARSRKSSYFEGLIDEVKIYSDILSSDEIAMLYSHERMLLGQSMIAHYELEGGCTDSTSSSYHGNLEENPPGSATFEQGEIGTALKFNGPVGNYVQLDPLFNPGNDVFSLFLWVRLDLPNGNIYQTILAQENGSGTGRPLLNRRADGDVLHSHLGGVETVCQTAIFENPGQWHHVGMTYDGKYLSLYVDGQNEATEIRTGELTDGGLRLAQQKDGINYEIQAPWNGAMDDVRIYNYALSEEEVLGLYDLGSGIRGNGASATISKCIIENNESIANGGGVSDIDGQIANSLIINNESVFNGGGLANCDGDIVNCTVVGNIADSIGGLTGCNGTITNTILWGNTDTTSTTIQDAQIKDCSATVTYSSIQDTTPLDGWIYTGIGNLDVDPDFVGSGDYHLSSESLCIDAGDEGSDYSAELEWNGERINLGVYGNTDEAMISQDNDGDGLSNSVEIRQGLDPDNVDSDGDGLVDGAGVVLLVDYPDGVSTDGVYVKGEEDYGTDPSDSDSDNDGVADGLEVIRDTGPLDENDTPQIGTINVPVDFTTIQEAIYYAINGDTIILASGTYNENIRFRGKSILLKSTDPASQTVVESTVICGDHAAPVVSFDGTEEQECQLQGITITTLANDNSLVGHWKFTENDNAKETVDSSGYGNDGTTKQKTKYMHTAGRDGGAYSFSGEPDYVTIVDEDPSLDISDNITISLWMKPKAFTNSDASYIIGKHSDTTSSNFLLYFYGDDDGSSPQNLGDLVFYATLNGYWLPSSDTFKVTELNKWYHVAWTYNSSSGGQLYIDSQPIGVLVGSGPLSINDASVLIGDGDYEGLIDDVRIYNEELNQAQIDELYGTNYPAIAGNGTRASVSKCNITGVSSHSPAGFDDFDGTVLDTRIVKNYSYQEGGAFAYCDGIIANCIVADNGSDNAGGGFYRCNGKIVNSTILRNYSNAGYGGAFADCNGSLALIGNSIIYDNGSIPTFNSLELSNCFVGYGIEEDASEDNPFFIDETDVLGDGLKLLAMSPYIDRGSNILLPLTITNDISGQDRIYGTVDLGAYEYEPSASLIYVNWDAQGAADGTSWKDAYTSLTMALNASSANDEIWVAKGTYKPGSLRSEYFSLKQYVEVYGGFAGFETSKEQRDWVKNVTILSGDIDNDDALDQENSYHVLWADDNAVIDGFTVTMGYAHFDDNINDHRNSGGGLYVDNKNNVEIRNCIFKDNKARIYAGAIMLTGSSTSASSEIENCQLLKNESESSGGALYITGNSQLDIINSSFEENHSTTDGGAIKVSSSTSSLDIIDSTFLTNSCDDSGGAIYANGSTLTIEGSGFRSNSSINNGGAIYLLSVLNCNVETTIFHHNMAGNETNQSTGGAVCNSGTSDTTFASCDFRNNVSTESGGAIINEADLTIQSSTFVENETLNYGGAIYNNQSDEIRLENCTIVRNRAVEIGSRAGGVYADGGDVYIYYSIFWVNTDILSSTRPEEQLYVINSTNFEILNSCIYGNEGFYPNAFDGPPWFLDYPTNVVHIRSNSPCIGGGSELYGGTIDIDGGPRTMGAARDVGADEYYENASGPSTPVWDLEPVRTGPHSVVMSVEEIEDPSGYVEYYFDVASGIYGGEDSKWITSCTYEDFGLHANTTSIYRVRAKDRYGIYSGWTEWKSVLTLEEDNSVPIPATMDFESDPAAISDCAITMTAVEATDPSGVEYYFEETSGNPGGTNSGWQDSRIYTDTGLTANTQYTYWVKTRDKSENQNDTAYSDSCSATTHAVDTESPLPNTMDFDVEPTSIDSYSVMMIAVTATDTSPIEYYFEEVSGNPGGTDSGWQESPLYVDGGLYPNTEYQYQVKARDTSSNLNETQYSAVYDVLTYVSLDLTAPNPDPATWQEEPATSTSYSITMKADVAYDESGVEYYFEETTTNPGSTNSGWQSSPTYIDSGLQPGTGYSYRVKYRDKGPFQNETSWSEIKSASTVSGSADLTAPDPDPVQWDVEPRALSQTSIIMSVDAASDPSGVEYYFQNMTDNSHDSGWQDSTIYTDTELQSSTDYEYRVLARDKSFNLNESQNWSSAMEATTFGDYDINFVIEDIGNKQIRISYTSDSEVAIRSIALSCDLDMAQVTGFGDVISTDPAFNYFMDYVKDNPNALLDEGHPIANISSAGVPDFGTGISVFSLNMACYDDSGSQTAAPSNVSNVITLQLHGSGANTIVISEDILRSSFGSRGITTNLPISIDVTLE